MQRIFGVGYLAFLLAAGPAVAEPVASSECADCHSEADGDIAGVTEASLVGSAHEGFDCVDCHADIVELPHEEDLAPVSCGSCHSSEAEIYVGHGRVALGTDPDIPNCADCHGSHEIRPSTDEASLVHSRNLPDTCGRCHRDTDLAKAHDIKLKRAVEVYETSVHGHATLGGVLTFAASCNDCHSTGGTAHRILSPGDPASTINHFNIPKTCGKCHEQIEREYWEGVHGQLTARGETDSPVCTTCHGEHGILQHDDPRARVSPTHVAEATCAPCHESAFLNEKYGLPAGRLASFVDSYHGLKSKAGDTQVANCASCHGGHRILPSSDPTSSIHAANLQKTCGVCHPGIDAALATTKIHDTSPGERTRWAKLFTGIYRFLIFAIIGGMLAYVTLDFWRASRRVRTGPQIRRMSSNAVAQHAVLTVTFVLLVITGFALRYSEAGIFRLLFGWDGGSTVRGTLHRVSAAFFTVGCLWHLAYLRTAEGRKFLRDMAPRLRDLRDMLGMVAFNLGRSRKRPGFGRFGYIEKAEYWALLWGAVVMFGTGMFLWFDNRLVHWVPKGFLEVMLVIHFYEAILATLAILVWHMYATVFNPAVYPGNPSWITGEMPVAMYEHERGAGHDAEAEGEAVAPGAAPAGTHPEASPKPAPPARPLPEAPPGSA